MGILDRARDIGFEFTTDIIIDYEHETIMFTVDCDWYDHLLCKLKMIGFDVIFRKRTKCDKIIAVMVCDFIPVGLDDDM